MSTSDKFDKIARIAIILALTVSIVLMYFVSSGDIKVESSMKYANLLFDDSRVHTIDIECDSWDDFIESCENEEYTVCNITIDGTTINSVGIRAKGNTSLSNVSQLNSDRYSFKIEFDHYTNNQNYYGLDKMCLNNIIQDNTYMKDYLAYKLMREMGVSAPLCSYAYITVNGEDWGLYLAVESIEESFALRNYGDNDGEIYKPDSISMGGGRGNGKEFDMENFNEKFSDNTSTTEDMPNDRPNGGNFNPFNNNQDNNGTNTMPNGNDNQSGFFNFGGMGNIGGGFNNSSSDVKLQYIDDNISSYSNIFDNAKTNVTSADKTRLISSLKTLSQYVNGEDVDVSSVVDVDSVIKYFVVHSYVCNGDSYTGSMIHNYYLYEDDGQLSMIPWDYNLSFGGFQGNDATSEVNSDIYSPCTSEMSSLPMLAWIFVDDEYKSLYEEYYQEFLKIDIEAIIEKTYAMIAQYVQKDPTAFCTYDEFVKGKETLVEFCNLRSEAISRQLKGDSTKVDASSITLSDMGSMGNMGGGGMNNPGQSTDDPGTNVPDIPSGDGPGTSGDVPDIPSGQDMPSGQDIPSGPIDPNGQGGNFPGGNNQGGNMPGGNGQGGNFPGGNNQGGMPSGNMPSQRS